MRFRVWAPAARRLEVVVESGGAFPMHGRGAGFWEAKVAELGHGVLYRYRLDGGHLWPDPASRFQPEGVHGPSMVVDPRRYRWGDEGWWGLPTERLVFYELHVGAFTPEGTFEGVRRRLRYLRDLGITALELMPVAEFPGRWNWGYDPAGSFAPAHVYGAPDDLRALVDAAHAEELAVFLDVVYNHFGPEGAYAPAFSPAFLTRRHRTPWGSAVNLEGEDSAGVRAFFVENAVHWLTEYHIDGLRLDAIHAIFDTSRRHFLAELAETVAALPPPRRYLIAEDHRNLDRVVQMSSEGGYGLDFVWSDDYHHQVRRLLTGDRNGLLRDFTDTTLDLAAIIRQGWRSTGHSVPPLDRPRRIAPRRTPLWRFVHFIENHDQVGNRPHAARLAAAIDPGVYRAAVALLLFAPEVPLLFMGQEWAAASPFSYFTDHTPELGRKVTAGRQREFARLAGLAGEVPDPQDPQTYQRSRLDWSEPEHPPHLGTLRLHQELLRLRPTLCGAFSVASPVEGAIVLRRGRHLLLTGLRAGVTLLRPARARPLLHTEEPRFSETPRPPEVGDEIVRFPRAAALLLEAEG